jgi:transposase
VSHALVSTLFAALFAGFELLEMQLQSDTVVISARTTSLSATCPHCGCPSARIHSYYTRAPHDLPISDRIVRLTLHLRRFRCSNPACAAVTFAERLPDLLQPYAQRTTRLRTALQHLGVALGGAAGARMSQRLHLPASRDTLLRLVQQLPELPISTPHVLGVDDFALRKGHRYGTILLDLERRRPIDLLSERTAAVLEAWLRQHPGVAVIARDRGPEYIRGATNGAPHALQVADRFHLLTNLREALERLLDRAHTNLRTHLVMAKPTSTPLPIAAMPLRPRRRTSAEAALQTERREQRLTRYETIRRMHDQGMSKVKIAKELGLSRWQVRRFVEAHQFPERAPKVGRHTILTPFEALLLVHWQQGERTTPGLFRVLQAAGSGGSIHTVRRWVQRRRHEPAPHTKPAYRAKYTVTPQEVGVQAAAQRRLPSARRLVWLLLKPVDELAVDEQYLLKVLFQEQSIATVYPLAQRFVHLVRQRDVAGLDDWLAECGRSEVPDLVNFATGLLQDEAAVRAALSEEWSTGQVEGQITRLKLLKRQSYGRASFGLLRKRVLHAA